MAVQRAVLGVMDYIAIILMLLVSSGIGAFYNFYGNKQKTTNEYLLAGRNMSIFPVAFSLMASLLSSVTSLGVPPDIYRFGTHYALFPLGYVTGNLLSSYICLPVFFDIQAPTAYEYIERRFGVFSRKVCSFSFVVQMILYMSVVIYAPALALSAVTNLSTWVSVISIGSVCTFYCTLGGMKAVLWTDLFQGLLMFLGMIAVIVKGCTDEGGIAAVFRTAKEGGRLVMPEITIDPEERYSVWNVLLQGTIICMSTASANQVQVQRLLTVKNLSRSRMALHLSIPLCIAFVWLNCFIGVIIYAYFADCDPMTSPSKPITSSDQLLPYFIVLTLSKYPGVAGLCICGIFSSALSTVSSAINSLTAVTTEDLIRPYFIAWGYSEMKIATSAKVITLFYGLLCVALTFPISKIGNIVQMSHVIFGLFNAPILGVFLLGMLTRRANEKGVILGLLISLILTGWMSFGSSTHGPPPKTLPVSTTGCSSFESLNSSLLNITDTAFHFSSDYKKSLTLNDDNTTFFPTNSPPKYFYLYKVSFMWVAPVGLLICLVVGYASSIACSLIAGESKSVPEDLLSPVLKFFKERKSENVKSQFVETPESIDLQKFKTATIEYFKPQNLDKF
ncbi:putative sodium-dependent multivitamin transporter isoform X2 [Uloborus diversus]|nr:putative sodium-dependent multivitamin transporter isoform X2 [Uloborus diversus]XP_054710660.1 putative sodium-dependent multivitamin transporter isoform X2 [Uloborus diversus]XP_054710661.1 putative sodium-dependent multivitamin transporter isoform X2 [Uloborus diversus]XP_054710662.1 putative sodium-dependent multivitamin transporter isoform X2 [Uloborus diversus]